MEASAQIDRQIEELGDWRGETYARLRKLINEADPSLTDEWKWGTGVWASKGNVVSIGAFKNHVKVNFFKGTSLADPKALFNAGLDTKATRSIDLLEGDTIDEAALQELVRAGVAANRKK